MRSYVLGTYAALDALIVAIVSMVDKKHGEPSPAWTRIIYLVVRADVTLNTADTEMIKARLVQDNIQLRVLGIGFPASPMAAPATDVPKTVPWFNVGFWHALLQDLPDAAFACADDVEEQALLPTTQRARSAPVTLPLTFGDPARGELESITISVQVLKATAAQRPMTQTKVYKPEGAHHPHPVDTRRSYYSVEEVLQANDDLDKVTPLPDESHGSFQRAFKLGASLVPIQQAMEQPLETHQGLEILHFIHASTYRRELHLGETSYVIGNPKSTRDPLALASLAHAAHAKDVYLLCRLVTREHADPKLCVLAPLLEPEWAGFAMVRVPFREDIKRFAFPPLDRVPTKTGEEIRTHPSIPTPAQQDTMDAFVDSMDLMDMDPEGDPDGWYAPALSYNPAIHGIKNAVKWRFLAPDQTTLPPLHPVLAQFLEVPASAEERARPVRDACADALMPVRATRANEQAVAPEKKARVDSESDATPDEDAHEADTTSVPVRGSGRIRLDHAVDDFEALVYTTEAVTEACDAMQEVLSLLLSQAHDKDAYPRLVRALYAYRAAAAEVGGSTYQDGRGPKLQSLPRQVETSNAGQRTRGMGRSAAPPPRPRSHHHRPGRRAPQHRVRSRSGGVCRNLHIATMTERARVDLPGPSHLFASACNPCMDLTAILCLDSAPAATSSGPPGLSAAQIAMRQKMLAYQARKLGVANAGAKAEGGSGVRRGPPMKLAMWRTGGTNTRVWEVTITTPPLFSAGEGHESIRASQIQWSPDGTCPHLRR